MSEQPEALRLADLLDDMTCNTPHPAAAELRRLYEHNQELLSALKKAADDLEYWGGYVSDYFQEKHAFWSDVEAAHDAIAKVEGHHEQLD